MNIVLLVERPTQFDAPFFRFAAGDPEHTLRVLFTGSAIADPVFDPELGMLVSWGIPLEDGYHPEVCPPQGQARWLEERLPPEACDLVITNGYKQRAHREAVRIAKRAGIATALRMDSIRNGPAARILAKRLFFALYLKRRYDLFLGAGSLTLDYLRDFGVPHWRRGLFPYAVDAEAFQSGSALSPEERTAVRERLGVPADARVVLSIAKFSNREAPWDLLMAAIQRDREDIWLVLAGAGPDRERLEEFAGEQGLTRVCFPGYIPYPRLPALYAAADLFVHPVREEFWGVSVQEALACGRPVITSERVGAGKDLIDPGSNGFVYTFGNARELAHRIDDALALPLERVRERSREILSHWDYATSWRHLLEAASRVVKRT
jgi:glycosyltransferase involved in cell wall biosynthesis